MYLAIVIIILLYPKAWCTEKDLNSTDGYDIPSKTDIVSEGKKAPIDLKEVKAKLNPRTYPSIGSEIVSQDLSDALHDNIRW